MTLGSGFRFAHLVARQEVEKASKIRRVRTSAGMKVFKRPIGTIITRRMYEEAKRAGRLTDGDGGGSNAGSRAQGAARAAGGRPGASARGGKGRAATGGQKAVSATPAAGTLSPKGQKYARQIGNKLAPANVDAVAARIDNDKTLSPKERAALKAIAAKKKADLAGKGGKTPAPTPAKAPEKASETPNTPEKPESRPPVKVSAKTKQKNTDMVRDARSKAEPIFAPEEFMTFGLKGYERESYPEPEGKLSDNAEYLRSLIWNAKEDGHLNIVEEMFQDRAKNEEPMEVQRYLSDLWADKYEEITGDSTVVWANDWVMKEIEAAQKDTSITKLSYRHEEFLRRIRDYPYPEAADDLYSLETALFDREQQIRYEAEKNPVDTNPWFTVSAKKKPPVSAPTDAQRDIIFSDKDGAQPTKWRFNGDNKPYEMLKSGGTIEGVYESGDIDGLYEAVFALGASRRDQRFKIAIPEDDFGNQLGQGGAMLVTDTKTGKEYFFKKANNGVTEKGIDFRGDAAAEVVSGKFGHAAFPEYFLDVDYAGGLAEKAPALRMQHANEMGDQVKTNAIGRWDMDTNLDEFLPKDEERLDPKSALAVHIFDYLTNQTDRHPGNYGFARDQNGTPRMIAFDNGASFYSFNTYPLAIDGFDIPDEVLTEPEGVSYEEWSKYYALRGGHASKGRYVAMEAEHAYAGDLQQLEKDATDIIEKFRSIDADAILADLRRRFPDMDEYEQTHIEANVGIIKSRIRNLEARQVTRVISSASKYRTQGK